MPFPSRRPLTLGARKEEPFALPMRKSSLRPPPGLDIDAKASSGNDKSNSSTAVRLRATMKKHLSRSVYTWACGEKVEGQEEEQKSSDTLIGWLILLVRASTRNCFSQFAFLKSVQISSPPLVRVHF